MVTPKNIIIQDLELADKEIRRLREEVKNLKLVISQMENTCKDYLQDRDTLREENKSLKKENKRLMSVLITTIEERDNAFKKIEQLKEELWKLVMSKSKD